MDSQDVKAQLEQQYGCPVWTTREGDFIPLTLMTSRHLVNVWHFLCRKLYHQELDLQAQALLDDYEDEEQFAELFAEEVAEAEGTKQWVTWVEEALKPKGVILPHRKRPTQAAIAARAAALEAIETSYLDPDDFDRWGWM